MKLETEAPGDCPPEAKTNLEGSGRSSSEADYSYIPPEVKPDPTTPNTKVTALFKHVHLNMSDCSKYESCSAPLCPLDPDMELMTHLRGEPVCLYLREYVKEGGEELLRCTVSEEQYEAIERQHPIIIAKSGYIRRKLQEIAKTGSMIAGGIELAAGTRKKHTDTEGKPTEPIPNHTETGNSLCDTHEINPGIGVAA